MREQEFLIDSTVDEYYSTAGYELRTGPSKEAFIKEHTDPQNDSRVLAEYYLLAHRGGMLTLDYWFYYTFN